MDEFVQITEFDSDMFTNYATKGKQQKDAMLAQQHQEFTNMDGK